MTNAAMTKLIDTVAATIQPTDGVQTEIADVLGVTRPFVSKCVKRGWFPINRAKVLADKYNLPLADLVQPRLRAFISN